MASPAVTYTFSNGSTADATQVNQNYSDLVNGLSDGTKDLNISALTLAGTATLNSAVILGASTSNDLTVNGSLASDFPVKTNTTYNFGAATKGLLRVYIGGTSTFTVALKGGTMGASYTLTLPLTGGTLGQFPVTDGSGVLSFRYPDKSAGAKTTTYAATGDETVIPCSGSAFTVTLPAIATYPYKRYLIVKTDATVANLITIARTGSDTFTDTAASLTTLTLNTLGESVEVINDGTSVWYVTNRHIPSLWTSFTPTITGCGTVTNKSYYWKRVGNSIHVKGFHVNGTVSAALASYTLPTSMVLDTTALTGNPLSNANGATDILGRYFTPGSGGSAGLTGAGLSGAITCLSATSTAVVYFAVSGNSSEMVVENGNVVFNSGAGVTLDSIIPISGWVG